MLLPAKYYSIVNSQPGSMLLETARFDAENHSSFLFLDPIRQLTINHPDQLPELFTQIEMALVHGFYVAGYFSYECGFHFEPTAMKRPLRKAGETLAWFGIYDRPYIFDHTSEQFDHPLPEEHLQLAVEPNETVRFSDFALNLDFHSYCDKIEAVRNYIAAGDIYQANFTAQMNFGWSGNAASCMVALRERQHVPYAAMLNIGARQMLSLSPELFFRIKGRDVTLRPMKGTAQRGVNFEDDERMREWLGKDPKNRSENLMIVDLLRNDIGRLADTGSVTVDPLFDVEEYDSLFQMTSTVHAKLQPNSNFYRFFRALFPCGSITGAPKVRCMQIIDELEESPRGLYTGSIGYFAPNLDAVFNVAIRTLVLEQGHGTLGIGGGITYDSNPVKEYEECLLKGSFLSQQPTHFDLIEALLCDHQRPSCLQEHMERMAASATFFNFSWKEPEVRLAIDQHCGALLPDKRFKLRVRLSLSGEIKVEATEIEQQNGEIEQQNGFGQIALAAEPTHSRDRFLYHKTTNRALYDRYARAAHKTGFADFIFLNERGELTEGSFNNLFIERDGKLLTPSLYCGLLPGVLRRVLLESGRAEERVLRIEDLHAAEVIFIGNSVRGLRRVRFVEQSVTVTAEEIVRGDLPFPAALSSTS
jgi:para-aminobenzoate synthetase/4-amino-4-deoxychorismate lyase